MSDGWVRASEKEVTHWHCGLIRLLDEEGNERKSRWEWIDKRGNHRGFFKSMMDAKVKARKLSGVQPFSDV